MDVARPVAAPSRIRGLLLVGLPLALGAALVTFIALQIPMPLGAAVFAAGGIASWIVVLPSLPGSARATVWRRVRVGAAAAVPAILAYDATRYGLVAIASMSFSPFGTFSLFGHAFIGSNASEELATMVGVGYHLATGIGFAIAFTLAVRNPTWQRGVAWALVLELAMLALYPAWLGLSLAGELIPVSLLGHVSYGAVLGETARRLDARARRASEQAGGHR